ncbi:DUF6049 family protein [Brachybacterium atlanticum]|uniref:DUF6049 family protein n=1 Tax=Brachybacterium atlanticum TaxID=2911888 RepID=UPI0021DFEF2F|nr:DUF6049 family protein [Brachybacterium atlanticum]
MPSSLPAARPVLAALLTVLVIASSVLVSGPATLLPAAQAAPAASPSAPPVPAEDAPVTMDLVSLTPTSLAPGGTLRAEVEVTNASSEPLTDLDLELRTRSSRVTDREALASWQADTAPDIEGPAIATSSGTPPASLAPGESTTLVVEATAEKLGYSGETYYWGTRRVSLTAVADDEPLAGLRTFAVWRPDGADVRITQSTLLPVSEADAASAVLAPEEHAASAEQGRLDALRALAAREDVDWWLDPALMDPPTLPETAGGEEAEGSSAAPSLRPDPASTAIADELDAAVGERTVLAAPYAGADLVSLRESGAMLLEGAARDAADGVWEARGISPRAQVLGVPGAEADAEALEDMIEVGATAAVVPSSSLRPDPSSAVTPSSVGVYESSRTEGAQLSVLAPDPVLSEEFSQLTGDSDAEQTRQRLLAETATIASEYSRAPRHLLISPSAGADLDPAAAGAVLDAFAEAPWIESGRTSTLLDTADQQAWTTDPGADGGEPYALGRLQAEDVHPSGPSDGSWRVLEETTEAQLLDPAVLEDLEGTWRRLDALGEAMEDDAPLDAARREILGATSLAWRGDPGAPAARAEDAAERADALQDRIQVVPASGYNVVSDTAAVPITITNGLDTPITVKATVTSDRPLVQVAEPAVVTVPAHGQTNASVDVEAVANGSVTLTTTLTTEDDRQLTDPVDVPLTVNPSWENWTTLLLVIAMGLLVVVGVARAGRTGSSTRAPAIRGPEDPEELARTGRTTLDTSVPERTWTERARHRDGDAADGPAERPGTAPDPDDAPDHHPDDTPEEDPR